MNTGTLAASIELVRAKIGLAVDGTIRREGDTDVLQLWPVDLDPNQTFKLCLKPAWRSASVVLELGRFAGALLRSIGNAATDAQLTCHTFVSAIRKGGGQVKFTLNGADVEIGMDWPFDVKSLEVVVRQGALVFEHDSDTDILNLVDRLMVPIFGIFAALIGVEDVVPEMAGEDEGRPYQTLVTKYERKQVNREACLRVNEPVCSVCGFDFERVYGSVGQGFIEIHHVEPLSEIAVEHAIDPGKDLVPLCSNCHAMAHRQRPAYSINELRGMLRGPTE